MAEFPVDPMLARTILRSSDDDTQCTKQMAIAAAMLSLQNSIFCVVPKENRAALNASKESFFRNSGSDVAGYVSIFEEFQHEKFSHEWARVRFLNFRSLLRARDMRDQFVRIMDRVGMPLKERPWSCAADCTRSEADIAITRCIVSGFFLNAAKLNCDNRTYSVIKSSTDSGLAACAELHPSSCLFGRDGDARPKLVVFVELRRTTKPFMLHVCGVDGSWLIEAAPSCFNDVNVSTKLKKRPRLTA